MSMRRFRYAFVIGLLIATCAPTPPPPSSASRYATIPLRFTAAKWIGGTLTVDSTAQSSLGSTRLKVTLTLADPSAAARDLDLGVTGNGPSCYEVRLLYRTNERAEGHLLQVAASDTSRPWSSSPDDCFFVGTEWTWNIVLASDQTTRGPDTYVHDTLLSSGLRRSPAEAIRVIVTRPPRLPAEFDASPRALQSRAVAASAWIPLRSAAGKL